MSKPKRYLEEKKVIDTINYWWRTAIIADGQPTLCDEIRALPPANVKPVVHGRWINERKSVSTIGVRYCNCSKCGYVLRDSWGVAKKFCPNCGADMRESEGKDE